MDTANDLGSLFKFVNISAELAGQLEPCERETIALYGGDGSGRRAKTAESVKFPRYQTQLGEDPSLVLNNSHFHRRDTFRNKNAGPGQACV